MNRSDLYSALFALVVHVGVGTILVLMPPQAKTGPKVVEFEVKKKEPPPAPKIEMPKPPEPPKPEPPKVIPKVKAVPPPVTTPPPNKTPPAEPPKPVTPVFGVNMDSTTKGDSDFAVPVGNTTMMDPKKSKIGPSEPLPAAPPPQPKPPEYKPISDLYVKTLPEIDGEACGASVKYPEEALNAGIEGSVILRIELDETGKVHAVRALKTLGHGLDDYAMHMMKTRPECRFKPAIGTDGKAVPYVIRNYVFRFELPR